MYPKDHSNTLKSHVRLGSSSLIQIDSLYSVSCLSSKKRKKEKTQGPPSHIQLQNPTLKKSYKTVTPKKGHRNSNTESHDIYSLISSKSSRQDTFYSKQDTC